MDYWDPPKTISPPGKKLQLFWPFPAARKAPKKLLRTRTRTRITNKNKNKNKKNHCFSLISPGIATAPNRKAEAELPRLLAKRQALIRPTFVMIFLSFGKI
jgi:hypothetical protein